MTARAPFALFVLLFACQSPQGAPTKSEPTDAKAAHPPIPAHPPISGDSKATAPATSRPPREAVNPHEVTPSGNMRDETVPGLKFRVPGEWARKPGSSPMRLAEFTLPGPGGDAELALYRFAGGGGDVASNVNRWRTQFAKSDGSPLAESDTKTSEQTSGALKITLVDLTGTYVAQVTPGAAERYSDPNYRMLAAIVEGAGDPFFFKAVGPATTMAVWEPTFTKFAETLALEPAP